MRHACHYTTFLFASLIASICDGSDVMIWSSVYEAMILMATCLSPTKNMPSPTSDSKRRYFSSSVRLNTCCSLSIEEGDCLRSTWMEELVMIGRPYGDLRKSSTSWVM